MSGSTIPYHLRPHKSVDRRIFLDLLSRFERWKSLSEYAYVSMGAYPVEDHKLVHRLLGIGRLLTFDADEGVVARQMFNRPILNCCCVQKKSGEIVANLDAILQEAGLGGFDGVIVWLDYTDPSKLSEQIREFESLLGGLRAGDIVRITVNAHLPALADSREIGERQVLGEELRVKRFDRLKERIGDYLPSWAAPDHMTPAEYPRVLANSLAASALNAIPVNSKNVFSPLSIVRYADGQQMLSLTGTVVARDEEDELRKCIAVENWAFASTDWNRLHQLIVPDLTVRERLFLEREVSQCSADDIAKGLGFDCAGDINITDFLDVYKKYYRFYPALLSAEL